MSKALNINRTISPQKKVMIMDNTCHWFFQIGLVTNIAVEIATDELESDHLFDGFWKFQLWELTKKQLDKHPRI